MKHRVLIIILAVACLLCTLCGCDNEARPATANVENLRKAYNQAYALQARGDYQQSMQLYMETENPAYKSGDKALLGDIYSRMGELHIIHYDYSQALTLFRRAYNSYVAVDDEVAQNQTLCSIAQSYSAVGRNSDAEMLYVLVYNWALIEGNRPLMQRCQEQISELYHKFDHLETLRQIPIANEYATDSVNSHNERMLYDYSDLRYQMTPPQIYRSELQQMYPDTIVYNPMNSVQIDYLRKLSDMRLEQLDQERTINILITIIACVVIVLLATMVIYQRRLRKAAVDNYMVEVQTLQQQLHNSESVISDMNDRIIHSSASVEDMSRQINSLFKSQFSLLDSLVNTYYETRDINRDKEAIYKQVKGEIAKLSSPKSVAELEAIINRPRGGVIAEIRTKYPSLSEQNITLLCYILAGFSAKSIGILLDCTIANVHTRRSRLKRQLLDLDAASGEKFAELLA